MMVKMQDEYSFNNSAKFCRYGLANMDHSPVLWIYGDPVSRLLCVSSTLTPQRVPEKTKICLPLPSNTGILFRERNVANIRTYWKDILYELRSMKVTAWTNFSSSWCGCMFLVDSSSIFFLLLRGYWEGKRTSCCLIKASSDALSVLKWKTLKGINCWCEEVTVLSLVKACDSQMFEVAVERWPEGAKSEIPANKMQLSHPIIRLNQNLCRWYCIFFSR